uniref:Ribosome production factor 2 homolog n=1 Tax=Neobodo designis TaxID=312471 RepID=A0A7S1QN17_NEODS|eukprot:CAMPEP_0174832576 /NCGR_PEP_ID=MMETSP1114-20130205/3747_1 /TAXON_ID=312471 /ORGANISM="Neobodo designis, Strain CCAP 1951/1" /LENGTH=408 /DNA_ID=CAMNT_0016066437 /DNA_START=34 /DNA_END=1260 /DNA_ORIENTATION=+
MSTVGRFSRRTPKTVKSRRAVKKMEAKVFEDAKKALFLTGLNSSDTINDAMVDLRALMQPHCKKLAKRNDFNPWTGTEHLEFLGFKNDCSLFVFGSHNKKRPNNLVLGRQFDFNVLDMIEFGVIGADRINLSEAAGRNCASAGSRPAMIFEGSEFEAEPFFQRLKNFFLDFFGGSLENEVNLAGVDRAIVISLRSTNGADAVHAPSSDCRGTMPIKEKGNVVVCFRHYGVEQTKAATSVMTSASNIKLVDIGPNFDLEVRRVAWADGPAFKRASRLPKQVLATLKHMHDNVDTDGLGNLRGQLHVGTQQIDSMALRKFKAHKEQKRSKLNSAAANISANAAAAATLEKRRAAKETGELATYDGATLKARKAAAEAVAAESGASKGPARKRHRKGAPDAAEMLGADVDI